MHSAHLTPRPALLASLERLTRVLATAIGAALFNKDGHETQDAVAPAGQGPQLCTAEHAHGQTGMSTMTAEGRAASVQRLWQLRGGAPRRSRGAAAAGGLPGSRAA